ncbi:MAG: hypothetical protein HQL96_17870 [Magnetococcales bacterium]|nr:hypothetical protein [Magnetococcales bacterium]
MNGARIRERLLQRNPFGSVAAGDPWEERLPDVPAINREAFEGVMRLVRHAGFQPREPLAALVLGEVGTGKSHLTARLRAACQSSDPPATFAWISPPESGEEPYRYLLREIADGLRHPLEGKKWINTWHHLAAMLIVEGYAGNKETAQARRKRYKQVLRAIHKGEGKPKRWWEKVRRGGVLERLPKLWSGVAEILVTRMTGTRDERWEAASWLRGEILEPRHLPRLRFDRSGHDRQTMEEEARLILVSLGQLLACFHMPLLVCFDRLEDLRTPAQHTAMDLMVTFLVDRMEGAVPVALARGQFWGELRTRHWNAQSVGRLESNRFEMTGCSGDEARDLVRCRLRDVVGEAGMAELFFDPDALLERLPPGRHPPRVVITLANRRLRELLDQPLPQPVDGESRLAEAWEALTRRIGARPHDEPARPERLVQVLRLYLFGESPPPEEGEFGVIEMPSAGEQPAKVWLVETVFHPQAMLTRLRQGVNWLERHPGGMATYVRDGRFQIPAAPKWPETNRMLHLFQERGGRLLTLTPERVARWHAIGQLFDLLRAGKLFRVDEAGREHPIPLGALVEFLRSRFSQG